MALTQVVSSAHDLRIPPELMNSYNEILSVQRLDRHWYQLDESTLWESLAFCILSSNVHYETAKSAVDQLRYCGILSSLMIKPSAKLARNIARQLHRPVYLPRRIDGSFRRYRFPNVRACNLAEAAAVIYGSGGSLHSLLTVFSSSVDARRFMSARVPGLGLKEASHFLRDIGYASDLAIIDVHIISFLKELELIDYPRCRKPNMTARAYATLEEIMQKIAAMLGLNLAVFDMAIWNYMRRIE